MQGEESMAQGLATRNVLQPSPEDTLWTLVKNGWPTSEGVSEMMSSGRDGWGMAWLCLCSAKREKVKEVPFRFLDLSGCNLSPRKIFFLLDQLPASVEGLTLGPSAVKGPALPLLRRFLEGVGEGEGGEGERGTQRLRLKSLSFAGSAVGPSEGAVVFSVLPSSLETLILKGNRLGRKQMRGLAKWIRGGRGSSLRTLDLEGTGLDDERLEILCGAVEGKSLKLETLNLSGNNIGEGGGMDRLCSVLCAASLPGIRVLSLARCRLTDEAMERLADCMGGGHLPNLETLQLAGNRNCVGLYLVPLERAVRKDAVPLLSLLDLGHELVMGSCSDVSAFLRALRLSAAEHPPQLRLNLDLSSYRPNEEEMRALGAGRCPSIQSLALRLHLFSDDMKFFFGELVRAVQPPRIESLDLTVFVTGPEGSDLSINEGFRLMSEAIQMGRFGCVRCLNFDGVDNRGEPPESTVFFTALSDVKLPRLSDLGPEQILTDSGATLLADAVRKGHLPGLQKLQLQGPSVTEFRLKEVMKAVVESEEGLPLLECLDFTHKNEDMGEGLRFLWTVTMLGKLPKLSSLCLVNCCLTDETVRGLAKALRGGGLLELTSLNLCQNGDISAEVWGELMQGVRESRKGLSKLRSLKMESTDVDEAGGAAIALLASGKVSSLEELSPTIFYLDQEGVGAFESGLREGRFPILKSECLTFCLHEEATGTNLDGLVRAIAESAGGLPSVVESLDLSGGRMGERALAALAASGGGGSGRGKLSHLTSLWLKGCEIDDRRLKRWGEVFAAHGCSKLESISFEENRSSIKGVTAFLNALTPQSLPRLRLLRLGGQRGLQGQEQRDEFASSVNALRGAVHAKGKLPKWRSVHAASSESESSGASSDRDGSEESESEGDDS
uniref:Uncharacterized protein n=1 Tax=Chromera velia CCMP2878 TaxID=1169474 RepID=A0A0G4HUM6_9ALVE|eukprot:Cvel_8659.t1-p1 / transcript=Cvel_8659.t1 / gene=Cvel_8659 / organism=Chromera_velia_CCMP2878 / gene_product=hypothetical protein / transcript_product=hypothetical protein / location=Cvel_scaffold483:17716-23263(+) / protein_length=893 / sequence_SO=supercontig / SO=protein_coding / is_pseudo=false